MASRKRSMSFDADMHVDYKEWNEASCPICMEHPHNAVLLLCTSHNKGCRSYICDTSYRHSNCLDRFKNLKADGKDCPSSSPTQGNQHVSIEISDGLELRNSSDLRTLHGNRDLPTRLAAENDAFPGGEEESGNVADNHTGMSEGIFQTSGSVSLLETDHEEINGKLKCPMCRGDVLGWKVVEEARKYLNRKSRSCSSESCSFMGNYSELRQHARRVHPTARPSDIDPSRQRAWHRLENQREYNDIVSAIHSAMPGAMVLGDYVIENGDGLSGEGERDPSESGRWLSTFFLFQMIGSMDPTSEVRGSRLRALSRHRRSSGSSSRRRYLWGENLLGLHDNDDDEDEDEDETDLDMFSDISLNSRRRRRLIRSRSDEDQH
ncbi:PREDICTED: uncharacterized protein LOC109214794 [Nicotiana attenuata]|uniref:Uncharacterized protein n=1 Tax=Nicotiana attenuata TaxID=49451 RepID=A0A1J6IPY3_NICAT|nr:PREDICTED: uncharacterized protein LOC109214794 [Nicotiana attenuata]XP_019234300.1 PREDICTED: uncharacterized protein LOC109214794 [Nicotiana attenuata]OIT06894.1 hypothetical protein A4A49_17970 [Nicotiana attenuata]